MLRIAIVSSYFPSSAQPYQGHSAYQTARELTKWAHVEAFVPLAVYPRMMKPRSFPYFRANPSYCPPGVRTQYIEYPALPGISRFLNGQVCGQYLLPALKRTNPDIILSYWLYPVGFGAATAAKTLKTPCVLCSIGSDLRRIPDPITRVLTKKALAKASFVITVSEELRQCAIQLGVSSNGVKAILNGCDPSIFRLADRADARLNIGVDQDAQLILYAGRLDPNKGLTELVNAVARLRRHHPRLRLSLLGEGIMREQLVTLARENNVLDVVSFIGPVSSAEVARWMTAANVFCLPSYSEGCPNVVIEALASGRPVVASAVGGIPELVTSGYGILTPPRNVERLTAALSESLTRNWDERAIARYFSRGWDQVAKETFEVCADLVRRDHRDRSTISHEINAKEHD